MLAAAAAVVMQHATMLLLLLLKHSLRFHCNIHLCQSSIQTLFDLNIMKSKTTQHTT